ncbi:MAG: prepilin-type N-terminal cleavage/methylation domain-containing protein [Planctomycetota bacterium]|nr:MAG: prepilin-type N-terminal cleavage/methylation domain-containing protein [Planctomycetota bacterium]
MRRHAVRSPRTASRAGFTLIEMLVATTLVVLMMLMFAQIYTAAIRSVSDQQAIARNDQRARAIDQVLRADLMRASFREIPGARGLVPLVNGDSVHYRQKGYFYFSENDPLNPQDDVLQFTMFVAPDARSKDATPFYGRCIGGNELPNTLQNHPDADDGIEGNDIGFSRGAEVAYFTRGGNLYRRVLLLRDPTLDTSQMGPQPMTAAGALFASPVVAQMSTNPQIDIRGSFHQRFDYSAYWDTPSGSVRFLGMDSLDNYGDVAAAISLGRSQYRYGFRYNGGTGVTGKPVEYATGQFFGRLTHAETNSRYNVWPGGLQYRDAGNAPVAVAAPNPIESNALTLDTASYQITAGPNMLFNSTRANEDLMMNNVEGFDIEVWDPVLAQFVQLGQSTAPTAKFGTAGRINRYYGPRFYTHPAAPGDPEPASENRVFDTGHPAQWSASPISATGYDAWRKDNKPPFRPVQFAFSEDADNDDTLDPGEDLNSDGILDDPHPTSPVPNRVIGVYRQSGQLYATGSIVFRPNDLSLSIGYRALRSGEDRNGNSTLDTMPVVSVDEVDVVPGPSGDGYPDWGTSDATVEPQWSVVPGTQIQDGTVTWEAFDNRVGLESIRITIRTRDTATGNPRQITLIHSFVEPPVGQ